MPSDYQCFLLSDLGTLDRGKSRHRPRYAEHLYGGPYPFVQTGDIKAANGRLRSFVQTYSEAGLAQSRLWPANTLCITIAANIAETALLTFPACFPDSIVGFTANEELCDVRYIEYWFRTFRGDVRQRSYGTVQENINLEVLRGLKLFLPPLATQRQVADAIGLLDDRIDLLRQTNTTLESIAQALFKSWFIDFDPVRAKAEGREPEGMDAATAALFPSEFDESVLGLIPKGWRVASIADMCLRISNGGTPARARPEFWSRGTVPWFKTGELVDAHLLRPAERITLDAIAKTSLKVLPRHAVLMAIYAAPTVGRLGILTEESAFNQACTGMLAKPEIGTWFLFQCLFHGREWFNSRANGAAQQNISKAIVESYQCVQASPQVLRRFDDLAKELYASAERNIQQAQVLAELRDTLLPRLISGKLRLSEAQEQAADALA